MRIFVVPATSYAITAYANSGSCEVPGSGVYTEPAVIGCNAGGPILNSSFTLYPVAASSPLRFNFTQFVEGGCAGEASSIFLAPADSTVCTPSVSGTGFFPAGSQSVRLFPNIAPTYTITSYASANCAGAGTVEVVPPACSAESPNSAALSPIPITPGEGPQRFDYTVYSESLTCAGGRRGQAVAGFLAVPADGS
jgi:hypothetical protein